MARRVNVRDAIVQLASAGLNQKQIAARLDRSVRQIRRYKSGEAKPTGDTLKKLERAASAARKMERETLYIEREERGKTTVRKTKTRKRDVALPREVPIPRATRREIRNYQQGIWKPEYGYHLSDWINYDVHGWSVADITRFVAALHKSAGATRPYIQLAYLAPIEDTSVSGTPYLANKKYQRSGSMIRDLGGLDAAGIARWVKDEINVPGRRAIAVAVTPNPRTRAELEQKERKRIWRARKEGSSKA